LSYLLYPFRLVVAPFFSMTMRDCLVALVPGLCLMALHYLWVLRSDVAFEEASLDASRRIAERIAAVRSGNWQAMSVPKKAKRGPFLLHPVGSPVIALFWKNLISAGNVFTGRFWIVIVYFVVFGGFMGTTMVRQGGVAMILVVFFMFLLAMSLIMAPQFLRQDFRQDLLCVDVLKLYPMPGWQIAMGELLAPVAIMTGIQWLLILLSVIFCPSSFYNYALSMPLRLSIGFGAALLLPLINVVTLAIPNAAVLIFPAWFQLGKDAPHGIEVMGQRIILMFGQIFVVLLSLVPASALFFGIFWLISLWIGPAPAVVIASVFAVSLLAYESWVILKMLGRRFDRFDLSAELNGNS
jgi:ABC-2 type transport system permease protein